MLTQTENRRSSTREKSFKTTTYANSRGQIRQTQLINSSEDGARLTTGLDVRVGDILFIRQPLFTGAVIEVAVEVQWVEPAGFCQVVGARSLEQLPKLVTPAA